MPDLTGQRLGQYQVLSRIARGSVATIYKAYQSKLDRYVAVKVLSPQALDEEEFLERFTQEARAIAQLDHPSIVPVYDFDRLGDTVYLVMKYVEGGTLKEMMTSQPLDLGLTVELISQVGLALGYAHSHGVIHRDVKPSNVLIAEGHWALLTDFGLAKILAGDRKLTRSGIGMGTPDYMSPEQAQGFPLDQRTDLYSLGATLYEMATGRVPFEAESSMAVIVKHMTEPPRPPTEYNPDLPPAVEQVILKAMEKDPDQRYQTAEEFISELVKAGRYARPRSLVGASVAARSMSGVGQDATPVHGLPAISSRPVFPERELSSPSQERKSDGAGRGGTGGVGRNGTRSQPGPIQDATRTLTVLWAKKKHRAAMLVGVALVTVVTCALALVAWGMWQAGEPTPTPVAGQPGSPGPRMTPTPTPLASSTPTVTPEPTVTFTPTPAPSPTSLNLRYLPTNYRISVGIYVKVVRPDGANLHKDAGFDQEFITTLSKDSVMYVTNGPRRADNLNWIQVKDLRTGRRGWSVQDWFVAYALPAQ